MKNKPVRALLSFSPDVHKNALKILFEPGLTERSKKSTLLRLVNHYIKVGEPINIYPEASSSGEDDISQNPGAPAGKASRELATYDDRFYIAFEKYPYIYLYWKNSPESGKQAILARMMEYCACEYLNKSPVAINAMMSYISEPEEIVISAPQENSEEKEDTTEQGIADTFTDDLSNLATWEV